MMTRSRIFAAVALSAAAFVLAACPGSPPVTLIERAIEARSTANIIEDNRIVVKETYVDFQDRATTKEVELKLYGKNGG